MLEPKLIPDGFEIEPDRFPNAILKQKAFQNRFYINFGAISKPKPKPKSFKTLMTSFKNRLCVYTPSNVIDDALMIDFGSQNGPKIGSKSLPKRFQRASEGALDEDSDSKLKKERSKFIASAPGRLKLEGFGAPRGRETGRGHCPHTPDNPWTSQGVGGYM